MPADLKSHFFQALLNAWGMIVALAPYVLSGIVLAALMNTFVRSDRPAKLLRGRIALPAAALLGVVSPACTLGAVPIFVEAIRHGAPVATAATFLVASALVNPQMFLLTSGALGLRAALAQAGASLLFAIGIGALVSTLQRQGRDITNAELSDTGAHSRRHKEMAFPWPKRLGVNALNLFEFVGFYFVLGTAIAALAAEFVPSGLVMAWVGEGKWWATPLAAVVSIPTYICGGGSIPFVARANELGMSMGAVLAFLIAGPATRITALAALAILFKKRAVLLYVLLVCLFAAVVGACLGSMVTPPPVPHII